MVSVETLSNGFAYVYVKTPLLEAKVALQGAHLFSYKYDSREYLWLSQQSDFEEGKAIRGGIPLCWPSFGNNNPALPQHGFARTAIFSLKEINEISDANVELLFTLKEPTCHGMWEYKSALEVRMFLGKTLTLEMQTTNLDTKDFELSQAFHTYFPISDIANIAIKGLENKPYFDALTELHAIQKGAITFDKEVDRVYQEVHSDVLLEDKEQTFRLKNEGSLSVVVWNPWIAKCARMSGMKEDAYREFVCIESANAYEDKRLLKAGQSHSLSMNLVLL
jgi:glucose-6-phosphate 1-epimerase